MIAFFTVASHMIVDFRRISPASFTDTPENISLFLLFARFLHIVDRSCSVICCHWLSPTLRHYEPPLSFLTEFIFERQDIFFISDSL